MQIKSIRGTQDILPDESPKWAAVENLARGLFSRYGYEEIRTPIIEEAALFKRSIGDATDIVQKQMYVFQDRRGRSIALRPEATASVVRAYLEHNFNKKQQLTKLFYIGPMFRAERPQAGRQRQFHQLGVEAIGSASPYLDAEVIALLANFLEQAAVSNLEFKINNLGCDKDKKVFAEQLRKGLKSNFEYLCEDCKGRFEKNILRILDCKNPDCKKLIPVITSYQCDNCEGHYHKVLAALNSLDIKYKPHAHLVRGLDYYTGTVFEVTAAGLGSQDAIAAGGRYDNLIRDLGGPDMPAVGFAVGVERLLMAQNSVGAGLAPARLVRGRPQGPPLQNKVYIAVLGDAARKKGFEIADTLRKSGITCLMGYEDRSLKSQLKAAANQDCKYAAILGDDELKKNKVILRDMSQSQQTEVDLDKFVQCVKQTLD